MCILSRVLWIETILSYLSNVISYVRGSFVFRGSCLFLYLLYCYCSALLLYCCTCGADYSKDKPAHEHMKEVCIT
jgi:hypothetical protein